MKRIYVTSTTVEVFDILTVDTLSKESLQHAFVVNKSASKRADAWLLGVVSHRDRDLLESLYDGVDYLNLVACPKLSNEIADNIRYDARHPSSALALSAGRAIQVLMTG